MLCSTQRCCRAFASCRASLQVLARMLAYAPCRSSKGYEIAEHLNTKFTHISPVWFQLRWDATAAAFSVAGQHDIDAAWMQRVSQPPAKVRPVAHCYMAHGAVLIFAKLWPIVWSATSIIAITLASLLATDCQVKCASMNSRCSGCQAQQGHDLP